jgi:hypothetical protein
MTAMSEGGWSGQIGGLCPVQGEGSLVGPQGEEHAWRFRARGEAWTLDVDGKQIAGGIAEGDDSDQFRAGYMPEAEVLRHMAEGIATWRGRLAMEPPLAEALRERDVFKLKAETWRRRWAHKVREEFALRAELQQAQRQLRGGNPQ